MIIVSAFGVSSVSNMFCSACFVISILIVGVSAYRIEIVLNLLMLIENICCLLKMLLNELLMRISEPSVSR